MVHLYGRPQRSLKRNVNGGASWQQPNRQQSGGHSGGRQGSTVCIIDHSSKPSIRPGFIPHPNGAPPTLPRKGPEYGRSIQGTCGNVTIAGRPVVVVTGASSGVGRATARTFGRTGAAVGLIARGRDGLDGATKELDEVGVSCLAVQTDIADPDQLREAASRIEEKLGPIDVWVNNAMTTVFSPIGSITPEEFRRVTEVTYLGAVYGTMEALRLMKPRDRGVIVQVGSALSYRAIPLQSAYCGAKHGLRGFTDSVRCELLHDRSNVRVTMVQLPALNTPQFEWSRSHMLRRAQPVPPIYQPELAADAIVWASGHARREVNVGGTTTATIMAQKLWPGLLDRYLGKSGYDAQQTYQPENPGRDDNLFAPASFDLGAHGTFNDRSHARSIQWWATRHRAALAAVGAATVSVAAAARVRRA
jgi:NAD(P)-dependent dehydrogenase (short-subunit alcohol dehydrogenase family)